jgi:hypothetical protein
MLATMTCPLCRRMSPHAGLSHAGLSHVPRMLVLSFAGVRPGHELRWGQTLHELRWGQTLHELRWGQTLFSV